MLWRGGGVSGKSVQRTLYVKKSIYESSLRPNILTPPSLLLNVLRIGFYCMAKTCPICLRNCHIPSDTLETCPSYHNVLD